MATCESWGESSNFNTTDIPDILSPSWYIYLNMNSVKHSMLNCHASTFDFIGKNGFIDSKDKDIPYSRKGWQIYSFRAFGKKVWWINRSAKRLLIVNTHLDGFSLVNQGRLANSPDFPPAKCYRYMVPCFAMFVFQLWNGKRCKQDAVILQKSVEASIIGKMAL